MTSSLSNYLRTYRKRSGLTQEELARLFGCQSGQIVSRYEHNVREPNLRAIFAFQIVFGITADKLFPRIYAQAENLARKRVHILIANLSKQTQSPRRQHKLKVLKGIGNCKSNTTII